MKKMEAELANSFMNLVISTGFCGWIRYFEYVHLIFMTKLRLV